MADETKSGDDILVSLKLKTDFAEMLKKSEVLFSGFQKKVARSSKGLETTINNMKHTVAGGLANMVRTSAATITAEINTVKNQMNRVQSEANKNILAGEARIQKIIAEKKRVEAAIQTSLEEYRKAKVNLGGFETPEKQQGELPGAYKKRVNAAKAQFNSEMKEMDEAMQAKLAQTAVELKAFIDKLERETIVDSTRLAGKIIRNIGKSVSTGLSAIKKEVHGIKEAVKVELDGVEKSTTKYSIENANKVINDSKNRQGELKKQVEQQYAALKEAGRELDRIRANLMGASEEKEIKFHERTLNEGLKVYQTLHGQYTQTERVYSQLSEAIDKYSKRYQSHLNKVKQSISDTTGVTQLKTMTDAALTNIGQQMRTRQATPGKYGAGEFKQFALEGANIQKTLDAYIAGIKEAKTQLLAMKATGLIDVSKELSNVDAVLAEYDKFKVQFAELKEVGKKIFPAEQWENEFRKLSAQITDIRERSKVAFQNASDSLKIMNQPGVAPSVYSIGDAKQALNEYKSIEEERVKIIERVSKEIEKVEKEIASARATIVGNTNKQLITATETYIKNLSAKKLDLVRTLADMNQTGGGASAMDAQLKATADKMVASISDSFKQISKEPNKLKEEIASMGKEITKVYEKTANKRFIPKGLVTETEANLNKIKAKVREYSSQIDILKTNIEKLQKLHSYGLAPNAGPQIDAMKGQLTQFQLFSNELNKIQNTAVNQTAAVHKKASQGMLKNAFTMIRNFRWQLAAFIYLGTKAVSFFKNTVLKMFDEIQKYRMDSYAIAAGVAMQMAGDIKGTFSIALEYSKRMMIAMRREAARTMVTMEDMTMLVKTFTQAGQIPKGPEDMAKISTIGSAIKVLTEGMANAGTQMRQELYAVIQGRQRATDQLAMFFKLQGININKLLSDAKKEGKDMMTVLAEALKPFAEMNDRLVGEYIQQKNALMENLSLIRMIVGEDTLGRFAGFLKQINSYLFNSKGLLTEAGKEIVTKLKGGMAAVEVLAQLFWRSMLSIFDILKSIGTAIFSVANVFTSMLSGSAQLNENASDLARSVETISFWSMLIATAFDTLARILRTVLAPFQMMSSMTKYILGMVEAIGTVITQGWRKGLEKVKEVNKEVKRDMEQALGNMGALLNTSKADAYWQAHINGVARFQEEAKKIASNNLLRGTYAGPVMMPSNVVDYDLLGRTKTKTRTLTEQSLEGPARFNAEYQNEVEETQQTLKNIQNQKQAVIDQINRLQSESAKQQRSIELNSGNLVEALAKNGSMFVPLIKGEVDALNNRLEALSETEGTLLEHMNAAEARRQKQIADYNKNKQKKGNTTENEYDKLKTKLENEILKPEQTIEKKFNILETQINNIIRKYGLAKAKQEELWSLFKQGKESQFAEQGKRAQEEYEQLLESIESKKPLNVFEATNNELDKWLLKMEETAKKEHFSDKQIEDLRRVAEETRKLRIEEEKRQQMMANVTGYYDVQLKYLEALNNAYTDVGKRREEMARSTLEYEKERTDLQLRMNEIVEKYYDSEKNQWKENSEQAQTALRLLGLELDALGIKFVTHMETIQRPFWESLKGMVQGWSDSLADVFTDAIFEVESFGEAINKLMQQIARDVIKAGIKTQITDRITDTLFGEGGLLGKKKKQPAKEGEAEAQAIQNTLADTIKAGWEKVTGFLKGGFDGIFGFLKSGFDWVMNGLSGLFGGGGSGGGLGGMLSSAFTAVKGWYGFADGGYITEPVIGMGLHSGAGYTFGERGTEKVISNEELRSGGQGSTISVSIPLTINGGGMSHVDINSMKRELERVVADVVKSYL